MIVKRRIRDCQIKCLLRILNNNVACIVHLLYPQQPWLISASGHALPELLPAASPRISLRVAAQRCASPHRSCLPHESVSASLDTLACVVRVSRAYTSNHAVTPMSHWLVKMASTACMDGDRRALSMGVRRWLPRFGHRCGIARECDSTGCRGYRGINDGS